jgi:glycerophosphoryl diester phosphodiesterase
VTLIIAHRGASQAEPENTVAAFRAAARAGADGVELDVRRTADDHLVVHHDAVLADGRPLRTVPSAELAAQIPTLDAALDACEGMFVNVEIKNDPDEPDFDGSEWVAHRLCALLARRRQARRWLISSFRYETVATCRVVAPWLRTAWLTEDCTQASIERTSAGRHDAIHPLVSSLDEPGVRAAHAAGLAVNTWTCDDPDAIRRLMAWGVDGICTNVPDVALDVRRSVAVDR